MSTAVSTTWWIGSIACVDTQLPTIAPDADIAVRIAQTVNGYSGLIFSEDPLVGDVGIRLEIDAASANARVMPCGHRFVCWAKARVFDLGTWIESYETVAVGRLIGGVAVVDHVVACGACG
ncbi:hypothetical protein [Beijerinckia sp. L45]|uniref:hypothetical protein n=1 Tax=Beijerinckia sp. L45 TaxID=1641855 RepID=UPI00131CA563|nr:hypothetical protein [Beijerinckia sp. L45]